MNTLMNILKSWGFRYTMSMVMFLVSVGACFTAFLVADGGYPLLFFPVVSLEIAALFACLYFLMTACRYEYGGS